MVNMSRLTSAGPAEIVRAKQKDDIYCDRLQKLWLELLLRTAGTQTWISYRNLNIGYFIYGAATTLSGLQTLGEEYTGIVQVNNSKTNLPKVFRRFLMLVLESFGNSTTIKLFRHIEFFVNANEHLSTNSRECILKYLRVMRNILPYLHRLHIGSFYCGGNYCQISKRLTGIRFVLVRKWLKDYQSLRLFRLLGIVTILHLVAVASQTRWSRMDSDINAKNTVFKNPSTCSHKCPLCLEERTNVSVTSCGHLFCWTCIMKWLETQNQCPICRDRVIPSRIVPLKNYI